MIGAKLGAGREADVYAWGEDAVVKLYRAGFVGHRAEAVALAALVGRGVAPRLVDTVDCDGRTGLVLERLGGADMLSLMQRKPWRALGVARALANIHLVVHEIPAPGELPELRQVLTARIADAVMPQYLRDFALQVLQALPDGDRICHGDYHPGNVLVAADRVAVIDWPNATRGVPEADHARTMLLLRRAHPLPDTPVVSRALITASRSVFAHGYARAYRDRSPQPPRQVTPWLVVHAAARLAERIEVERTSLIGFLQRAQQRAER